MWKHIQVFFRNEDDAETARIKLAKYNTQNLEIGKTPDDSGPNLLGSLPFASMGTGGVIASGAYFGGRPFLYSNDDEHRSQYVLSVGIKEADMDEIIHMLRENGGFIEVVR